jgi:SAM-dependent methyltransferase
MDKVEFDGIADDYYIQHQYNIAFNGKPVEYYSEYKIRVLRKMCEDFNIDVDRIVDFGSGIGNSLPHIVHFFPGARVTCADISRRSLEISEARFPGFAHNLLVEDKHISAADDSYDITFAACVFHHIAHEEHVHWLRELRRVTRPGGLLAIFEHNPFNPLTVYAVNTCPFDANARLIRAAELAREMCQAGWQLPGVKYHVFFPGALSVLRNLERFLSWAPFGAQYSLAASKAL